MSLKEMLSDITDYVKHRISNPLTASFAFAWFLWNHRLIGVLLTLRPISEAYGYIDTIIWPDTFTVVLYSFVGPLASALFYVYFVPVISRHAVIFTLRQLRTLNEKRREMELETRLSVEESRHIRKWYEDAMRVNREQIETYESRFSAMKREIADLSSQLPDYISQDDYPLPDE